MSTEFASQFILDKSYFVESYEASVDEHLTFRHFQKAAVLVLVGMISLLFLAVSDYFGWFMVALGAIDALGVYYRKPWWLARQMLSRAANSEITLLINEHGINSSSRFNQLHINWQDIARFDKKPYGYLFVLTNGSKHYLSLRSLTPAAMAFVEQQLENQQASA